ncbi:hypothetical protein ABNB59_22485, partial [Paenibacillus larvae]
SGECTLKKVRGTRKKGTLSQVRQENIYLAIQTVLQDGKFSIKTLCEIVEIPRSSYYKWLKRKPSVREQEKHSSGLTTNASSAS